MSARALPALSDRTRDAVWRVVVDLGAHPDTRGGFDAHWPQCVEYRFCGSLGFGGKIWAEGSPRVGWTFRVSCYPEDRTPDRDRWIAKANERLAVIAAAGSGRG